MSSARSKTDRYANVITPRVEMSAANTLTFSEIDVGLNLFDKVGLLISRIEFYSTRFAAEMAASGDFVRMAITASNQITTIAPQENAVIAMEEHSVVEQGTAASAVIQKEPFVQDWSQLPMNGILVSPKPLYIAANTGGFSQADTIDARIFFTIVKLKDAEYFELLESRRFFG